MTPSSSLSYQVFVSDSVPQTGRGTLPNGDPRMWSPISSTLISGDKDAVLVDPPMTIAQTERVGDWIEASGKRLSHIYITHGHGDHWFGTAPLLARFPGAAVLATPGTIEEMRAQGSTAFRASFWDAIFPDQIPPSPVLAEPLEDASFTLEGNELCPVDVGHTDTDNTTMLFVPSIRLLVAGDAVYNGVHPYLTESAGGGIDSWLKALDKAAGLHPVSVVAGHKDSANSDTPDHIDNTRSYLLDAARLLALNPTPTEFFDAMIALHPDRINSGALWGAAATLLD